MVLIGAEHVEHLRIHRAQDGLVFFFGSIEDDQDSAFDIEREERNDKPSKGSAKPIGFFRDRKVLPRNLPAMPRADLNVCFWRPHDAP
jgi:hypothetical protein